jgi:hemolysin activation/secretion protein
LNKGAIDYTAIDGSLSLFHSFGLPEKLVFAARVGGGRNLGNYNFYQAQVLSGRTEIRGYRKTRFYGDSKMYGNFEMRLKLAGVRTYLFPASIGVLGFFDTGRVWYKNKSGVDPSVPDGSSSRWHNGWGGGIWFTPFNMTVLSVEAGHSSEGTLGYLRLGFLF